MCIVQVTSPFVMAPETFINSIESVSTVSTMLLTNSNVISHISFLSNQKTPTLKPRLDEL